MFFFIFLFFLIFFRNFVEISVEMYGCGWGGCKQKYFSEKMSHFVTQNIKVSPLPLPPPKKLSTGGYMGNWTKYMWTNPKYCNTEAKNTLDARCISIQCWYDRTNIFWEKLVFPLILCVQRHLVLDNKPGCSKVFVYIAKLSPNVTEQCYVVWTSLRVANVLR